MYKVSNKRDAYSELVSNTEITKSIFRAIYMSDIEARILSTMAYMDSIILSAEQTGAFKASSLRLISPSISVLSGKKYIDENGVKKIRRMTGYRLGDIGVAGKACPEMNISDCRGGYERCVAWFTAHGLFIQPTGQTQLYKLESPFLAAENGDIACLAPVSSDFDKDALMNINHVKEVWTQNINDTFFPLKTDIMPSHLSFNDDWMYSKSDIFTLSCYAALSDVLFSVSNIPGVLDWIMYSIYNAKKEQSIGITDNESNAAWSFDAWNRRLLYSEDKIALEIVEALDKGDLMNFDYFAFFVPPMNSLIASNILKKIDLKKPEQRYALRNRKDIKENENADIAQTVILAFLNMHGTKYQKVAAQTKEFFKYKGASEAGSMVEKIRENISSIRQSDMYIKQSEPRLEFYRKSRERIPEGLIKWLRKDYDLGAYIDSISTYPAKEKEYAILKEYVQKEMAEKLNDIDLS